MKRRMFEIPSRVVADSSYLIARRGGVPVGAVVNTPAGSLALGFENDPAFSLAAARAGMTVTPTAIPVGNGDVEMTMPDDPEGAALAADFLGWFRAQGARVGQLFRGTRVQASAGPITVDLTDPASRRAALAALKAAAGAVNVRVTTPPGEWTGGSGVTPPPSARGPRAWFNALPIYAKVGLAFGVGLLALDTMRRRR